MLLQECIEGLHIKENGIYVDGTLGGAGHSKKILEKLSSDGILIGIDRDTEALNSAKETLKDYKNVKYVHGNHDDIKNILIFIFLVWEKYINLCLDYHVSIIM